MKMISRTTLTMLALGIFIGSAGWMAAQETTAGAVSGQELAATVHSEVPDNGALPGDSHVRIVRLSDVKGMLALDRKTGLGFEQTMQNMPIVEGAKLRTADGYAEVEFEDNSTLRLAPNSQVEFPLLALRSSGAKASTMNVVKGTVYVSTENTKGNEFLLEAGEAKMMVAPSTHLRLEFDEGKTVVSVFKGSVEVQRGAETTVVDKKQSLTLGADQMTVAKKVAEMPFDAWDKESIDYHDRYSKANAFAGSGNAFGLSDLNYYGSFVNAGGCGQMWQPYMVSAGWNPYANGVWALYPGAGYSWVSPYPWGWLPYHSGSWSFCQGVGWGWQPGGNWNGLNNIAGGFAGGGVSPAVGTGAGVLAKNPGVHSPLRPAAPQVAAGAAKPSLVLSNQKPMVFSKESTPGNFVFQKDSAGLGVPRGSLGNLNHISNDVGRHGSASMPVYAATPNGGNRGGEGNFHGASHGPATLRQGSPGEGSMGVHGNSSSASSGSQQGSQQGSFHGSAQGSTGAQASQASPSYHGGGGSQPAGGAAPMSNAGGGSNGGGARGASASPK
jgi:ferric-dicitrate binding protein FerR (iron transport regulator)